MTSLIIHIAQPCLLSKEIQEGKNDKNNCWMSVDGYPSVANYCFNSDCILTMKMNLMKASVVCLCSDAHPWLRARCQQTSQEPQKRSSGSREYPELQLKPVGESALHLFMIVKRRRENPERVEFVHFFWMVGKKGANKSWRCGEWVWRM